MPVRYSILAAVATIIGVSIATYIIFGMFGLAVQLDGP
jgi:hypothetical protein